MKRKSVLFEILLQSEAGLALSALWFCVIGFVAGASASSSLFGNFTSFLIGLGFGLAPILIGLIECVVRNVLGTIYDVGRLVYGAVKPNEEKVLRDAQAKLRSAELQLEIEKTLLKVLEIEQEREFLISSSIDRQLLQSQDILDRIDEGRSERTNSRRANIGLQ